MTTPNYNGYIESDEKVHARLERLENAHCDIVIAKLTPMFTEREVDLFTASVIACNTDQAHVRYALHVEEMELEASRAAQWAAEQMAANEKLEVTSCGTRQTFEAFVNSPDEAERRKQRAASWGEWKKDHQNSSPYNFNRYD